jgi:hypothetical protein
VVTTQKECSSETSVTTYQATRRHIAEDNSPRQPEQHSIRCLHHTDCHQERISDTPQAIHNVRVAAISHSTNSTSTKLHIFARPKTEHHVDAKRTAASVAVTSQIHRSAMFLLLSAGNFGSSEIGCNETANFGMTFRENRHVMMAGYMPTELSKHARTHVSHAFRKKVTPSTCVTSATTYVNSELRVCNFPSATATLSIDLCTEPTIT